MPCTPNEVCIVKPRHPPSSWPGSYNKLDDIAAEITPKCIFCGEFFKYESKRVWNNSGEYSAKGWEIFYKVAQMDIYLLHFSFSTDSVQSLIKTTYNKRIANLKSKLKNANLETVLKDAAHSHGVKLEDISLKVVSKIMSSLIHDSPHCIGEDSGSVYYDPVPYKCHKACWPQKESLTIEELLQTQLRDLLKYPLKDVPKEYSHIIPAIKKIVVTLEREEYDPFNIKN